MPFTTWFSVSFFLLLGGVLASAEGLAVRCLALRSGEASEVYLRGAKGHEKLDFSATQPGAVVQALVANPLPLYRMGVDGEGKEEFVVAHKVKVPVGARGILLLGLTSGKETRYVAIEDDFGSARFSDWLLINTSARPVAFKVGGKAKPILVAPGKSVKYKIKAEEGKGAAVLAQAPFDGKSKTFFSTYWPVHPGKRTIVLFADDGEKIRVKRISDKLVKPTPVP